MAVAASSELAILLNPTSPDAATAAHLAATVLGLKPAHTRRFMTGSAHFVYEVSFNNHRPIVVRMASRNGLQAIAGARTLSRLLRPLGVPLPEILAADLDYDFPYLILERLQGVDLSVVMSALAPSSLTDIAAKVAGAQSIVSTLPSAGRYGFAVSAQEAPHERWIDVLRDNLDRSRKRIESAGLFDSAPVDEMEVLLAAERDALDGLPSKPFLHDTTTKNVIVTEKGRFSGIVDVDDLCFGDPRYVVALTLAAVLASGAPVVYVEAWMKNAGFRDDHIFRLYVALFIVDFMSEHGQTFNDNRIQTTEDIRERLRLLFFDCLTQIDAAR